MAVNSTIDKRVNAIEERNKKVSLDKRWETSWTRRISIAILTYLVVLVYLFVIGNANPWINAIVPPTGFILSTLAMGRIRKVWDKTI